MADKKLDKLLAEAQAAYKKKDKRKGEKLVGEILSADFNHLGAWQLLHRVYGGNRTFGEFQRFFTLQYYPDKLYLVKKADENAESAIEAVPRKKVSFWRRLFGKGKGSPAVTPASGASAVQKDTLADSTQAGTDQPTIAPSIEQSPSQFLFSGSMRPTETGAQNSLSPNRRRPNPMTLTHFFPPHLPGAGDIVLEKLRGVGVAMGHPLSEKLNDALNKVFLNSRLFEDAASMKWSKMLTNLIANPTSAILDMTAGEVFANRGLYKIEIDMLKECLAVMKAQGLEVVDLPGTPVRALALAATLPLWLSKPLLGRAAGAGRGAKMPSFHIDLHSGRGKSEVEYLHGAVVHAGEKYNVPTPVNKVLTETLLALPNKEIPLDEFAHQPEKLLKKL